MTSTVVIILISILFSAFFSGMEIAFVSANKIHLEIEKKQKNLNSEILNKITKKPSDFIASMILVLFSSYPRNKRFFTFGILLLNGNV